MKLKLIVLSLALTQTVGCGSGIPVQNAANTPNTNPAPTPSLDLIATQGGVTVASGRNATSSTSPHSCLTATLALNGLFKAAQKVAFGVSTTHFACGNCQIKIKCVPGTTVSIDGKAWNTVSGASNLLVERQNEACPTNGEIELPTNSINGSEHVRFTLTSGSDSDVEYFTCVNAI